MISCPVRHTHDQISSYLRKKLPLEVPDKGKLVYVGPMAVKVKAIKILSVSTSAIALSFMPFINVQIAVGSVLSCLLILQPILIHLLNKRYVTWIYYKEETNQFTASTYNFIGRSIDHVFTPGDIEYYLHGLFSSVKIRGKPLLIDAESFFDKKMYMRMMRYDSLRNGKYPKNLKN